MQRGIMQALKTQRRYHVRGNDLALGSEEPYVLRVRDLDEEDKPRERLLKRGPEVLSQQELLAIVFGVGTRKEEVMTMSHRVLREYGDKSLAHQRSAKTLSRELDIPISKACQIVAAYELGRRSFQQPRRRTILKTPKQVFAYLTDMRTLTKEQLRGLYLNSRYQLIHDEVVSIGTITASLVHPREVFRPAIEYGAVALILAHNHPSGSLAPTSHDIETTRQLIEAGQMMGIELLDHIIIAGNKYRSILPSLLP